MCVYVCLKVFVEKLMWRLKRRYAESDPNWIITAWEFTENRLVI